jgi:hypothetical protein
MKIRKSDGAAIETNLRSLTTDTIVSGKLRELFGKSSSQAATAANSLYSHSIVPGGFDVMSYTTRLTPLTSLMMRVAVSPRNFMSKE